MNETAPETALRATQTGERHLNDEFRRSMLRRGVEPQQIPDLDDRFFAALRDAGWVDPEEAARLRSVEHELRAVIEALAPVLDAARTQVAVERDRRNRVVSTDDWMDRWDRAVERLAAAVDALDSGSGT